MRKIFVTAVLLLLSAFAATAVARKGKTPTVDTQGMMGCDQLREAIADCGDNFKCLDKAFQDTHWPSRVVYRELMDCGVQQSQCTPHTFPFGLLKQPTTYRVDYCNPRHTFKTACYNLLADCEKF